MIYESPVAWLRQEEVLVNIMGQSVCQKIVLASQVNAQADSIMCSNNKNTRGRLITVECHQFPTSLAQAGTRLLTLDRAVRWLITVGATGQDPHGL